MTPAIYAVQSIDSQLIETCGVEPGTFCEFMFDWTENDALTTIAVWFVEKPLRVLVIFLIAYFLKRLAHRAIDGLVIELSEDREAKRKRREEQAQEASHYKLGIKINLYGEQAERATLRAETLGAVLRSLSTAAIYSIAFIIGLAEFGVSLGPLIAGAGIAGVALGFGAQSLVKDFLSGMFLIIEDQFGVGDSVDVGEAAGIVEEVTLRVTKVRDVHGTLWFVPNGEIRRVANKSQIWARAVMDIEVAYDTDLNAAAEIIKAVADEVWQAGMPHATIMEEPEIWGVEAFGSDSISIRLVVKTEPGEQWATAREIRGRLKPAFDEHGIEIPFPQRTVWIKDGNEPVDVSSSGVVHGGGVASDSGDD